MKHMENWMDLVSMSIGIIGALLKGIKKRFTKPTIFLGMMIAGILTFSFIGLVEMFFNDLSPKVLILISFCIGWIANEITEKLDELVGDIYEIFIGYIRNKFKSNKNENDQQPNSD